MRLGWDEVDPSLQALGGNTGGASGERSFLPRPETTDVAIDHRVISPSDTLQTDTTAHTEQTERTEHTERTETSMDDDDDDDDKGHYSERHRRWRKKKKRVAEIRRVLERDGRRQGQRGRGRSHRSVASSRASSLGRSVADDDESYYSVAELSCQNVLARLIQTRCGNLEDTASICDASSDDEYDESIASTAYSSRDTSRRGGRLVSFDDESDDRDRRQQRVLLHKQNKQLKSTVKDHPNERANETSRQNVEERSTRETGVSDRTGKFDTHSVLSNGSKGSKREDTGDQPESVVDQPMQMKKSSDLPMEEEKKLSSHDSDDTQIPPEDSSFYDESPELVDLKMSPTRSDALTPLQEETQDDGMSDLRSADKSVPDAHRSVCSDKQGSIRDTGSYRSNRSFVDHDREDFTDGFDMYGDRQQGKRVGVGSSVGETEPNGDDELLRFVNNTQNFELDSVTLTQVDMHDRNFIKIFVSLITSTGVPLMYHTRSKKQASMPVPTTVTVQVRLGVETPSGDYTEPQLIWWSSGGVPHGVLELFDIESLDQTSAAELKSYPLAIPSKCLILRTERGDEHIFEAVDESVAHRFVHGMRWIVARLAFNLIIGNLNVSCELLDVDGSDSEDDRETPGSSVPMKAMNDVTNHLVNKSIGMI